MAAFCCIAGVAEDRLVVFTTITIDSIEARLVIDSGSDSSALFRAFAIRLQPEFPVTDKAIKCSCRIDGARAFNHSFNVIDAPPVGEKFDGIIGWNLLSKLVVSFDWDNKRVVFYDKVPDFVKSWSSVKTVNAAGPLVLQNANDDEGQIVVDTGSESGVGLNSKRWTEWQLSHVNAPMTLAASWNYHDGPIASHQSWAADVKVGSLVLEKVFIEEAQPLYTSLSKFEAVVGAGALCHYEVVIDGPGQMFYFKNHKNCNVNVSYNRIGAVFLPDTSGRYVASVVDQGPAHRAGIREGDTLQSINGTELSKIGIVSLRPYLNAKAGEEISLIIFRDKQTLTFNVKTEDIFKSE